MPTEEGRGQDDALFDPAHQKHMGQNPTSHVLDLTINKSKVAAVLTG